MEQPQPASSPSREQRRVARPVRSSAKFHRWMASLTVVFMFAIPILLGAVAPVAGISDDMRFNIGLISVLVSIGCLILWGHNIVENWLDRPDVSRRRRSKNR